MMQTECRTTGLLDCYTECRQSFAKINNFYHVLFFFVYNVLIKDKI